MSATARRVFVTGGSRGIGKAIALRLAREGASTVAIGYFRSDTAADETAEELRALGAEPVLVRGNVTSSRVAEQVAALGRLDVLVNNAAGNFVARAEDITPNGWNAVVGIVLNGSFYCARAAGRQMLRQGSGKILSVVASYAWLGGPGTVHSAAAKAGVIAMTKTLAVEWGPRNLQVNCLCPGFVDTEQSRDVLWPTEEARAKLISRIPAGRFGSIEEVVESGFYLCSPAANYINGEVLTIDGGEWLNKGAFVLPEAAER